MSHELNRICPACCGRAFRRLFEQRDMLHGLGGKFTVIQCEGCGLVSYDPLDPKALTDYYPKNYYAYQSVAAGDGASEEMGGWRLLLDDIHLGIRHNSFFFLLFLPLLWFKEMFSGARFLRPVPRGRLLDVGCGNGAFLLKARRMGFDCTGLEPGGTAAESLQRRGIPVHLCALEELDPRAGPFDVITLNHVFEHLTEPEAALKKLRVLLAPGGAVARADAARRIIFSSAGGRARGSGWRCRAMFIFIR